ncbi:MAG: triose-phosphate isomerase [Deltaproteobacteria bacterium]
MKRVLIVGNWKLHLLKTEACELADRIAGLLGGSPIPSVDVVVAPAYTLLDAVYSRIKDTPIELGAQNAFWEEEGAYTGEVSCGMLREAGCRWVIVGHSERRKILGETDTMVRKKTAAALNSGIIPIVCVGETLDERQSGSTIAIIERQIYEGLQGIALFSAESLVVAYEPIWAIGTGCHATADEAQNVHSVIRHSLRRIFGDIGRNIKILYGGSVTDESIKEMLAPPDIDGALVGGASLRAETFAKIVQLSGE